MSHVGTDVRGALGFKQALALNEGATCQGIEGEQGAERSSEPL